MTKQASQIGDAIVPLPINKPTVNSRESPGRKKPRSKPVSAITIRAAITKAQDPKDSRSASGCRMSFIFTRPQQESNLRPRLRRAVLYPLSYGGSKIYPDYQRHIFGLWDISAYLGLFARLRALLVPALLPA